jgi:hypothetical protein
LSIVENMQCARDEKLEEDKRIAALIWLRDRYFEQWMTGVWPLPDPDPPLTDATRLPAIEVTLIWRDEVDRTMNWAYHYKRDERLPSVVRWAFACYTDELMETYTMVRHMENARDSRLDKKWRIGSLRWLRDHYPKYSKNRNWPVAELLSRYRDTEGKWPQGGPPIPEQNVVPRISPDGQELPALGRKLKIDS